jgi:hypothetical protein
MTQTTMGILPISAMCLISHASSLGVYKTGEIYNGKYGKSLRLHGLSSTNSNDIQEQ